MTIKELEDFAGELGLDARIQNIRGDFVLVALYGYALGQCPVLGNSVEAAKENLTKRAERDSKYITKQEAK